MAIAGIRFVRRSWRLYFLAVSFLSCVVVLLHLGAGRPVYRASSTYTRVVNHAVQHPALHSDSGLRSTTSQNGSSADIVVAALQKDDVSWIESVGPAYNIWKYEVDNPSAQLAVPMNKGHEAMVYLT